MSINKLKEYKQRYVYQVMIEAIIFYAFIEWANHQHGSWIREVFYLNSDGGHKVRAGALYLYVTFLWSMLMPLDSLFNSFYDKLLAENDTSRKYKLLFLVPVLNIAVLWWLFVEKIDKYSIIIFLVFYIIFISWLIDKILKLSALFISL
ncbi:hypothetical protein [uncultured Phascolarctobacterium sp.]|uniref:hypothetical protein n=1 Tax=uncultured Phascolarctobacterium sp. TaxID=512296 RepID=UPI0025F583DC|nr:hypothetical protein [uncultured Phascolarctobacterium sp.]